MVDALQNYEFANKKYNAALAATGDKDYEEKARIFESAASMYAVAGNTKAQSRLRMQRLLPVHRLQPKRSLCRCQYGLLYADLSAGSS